MAMAMAEPEPLAAQHSARDLHTLRMEAGSTQSKQLAHT